jgi:hypothetical protein
MNIFLTKEKTLTKGTVLKDDYILDEFIKEGNISRIYKAFNKTTGKYVIIKELISHHIDNHKERRSAEEQFQI